MGASIYIAAQTPTYASTQFSKSEISGPSGYFSSKKAGFSFYWKNLKTNRGIQTMLVYGDFKAPQLQIAVPTLNKLSKDKHTFLSNYKMVSSKGKLLKQQYYFKMKKLSSTKYQVKLACYNGGRVPSAKGKSFTFTKTKKSPAKSFASAYSKPAFMKKYTDELNQSAQKQYEEQKAKGQNVQDPSTSSEVQSEVKQKATEATNKSLKQFINGFNNVSN